MLLAAPRALPTMPSLPSCVLLVPPSVLLAPSWVALVLSEPTVPSGPMVVSSGLVGACVVWGTVVVVVGAVVARVVGAVVVICVDAVLLEVVLPLLLRQAVSIAAVRTRVKARMLILFIVILL